MRCLFNRAVAALLDKTGIWTKAEEADYEGMRTAILEHKLPLAGGSSFQRTF
jgi:hypothetical protein